MDLSERLNKVDPLLSAGPASRTLSVISWVPAFVVFLLISMSAFPLWSANRLHVALAELDPVGRLALSTVIMYLALKIAAVAKQKSLWPKMTREGWFWYWTIWPGMRLHGFTRTTDSVDLSWLQRGLFGLVAGATVLVTTAIVNPGEWWSGWLGIVGLLLLVHFGYADILSWGLRKRGFRVKRLFVAPERSTTLVEFWSRRWNVAFVEMDQVLFLPSMRRISKRFAPLMMMALSGVMHELAISYPANAGWGLPMLYFAVHGLLMRFERLKVFKLREDRLKRWWTRFWVIAPVGAVFHRPFRDALPNELVQTLGELIT